MADRPTLLHDVRTLCAALALAVVVGATYAPVARFAFVNFDDPLYITKEPRVREGVTLAAVGWAFTGPHAKLWHPLTTLSHLADVELCGFDAGCHHVASVVLHAANAALVLLVFADLTGRFWPSFALAVVFALHPLRIESVAWIAERKDVLSTFLGLLALFAYGRHARTPSVGRRIIAFGLATAAMLAKPMLVTLPAIFLLLDVWPLARRRHRGLLTEKIPICAVAVAVAIATYVVQRAGGAVMALDAIPLGTRVANAMVSYVRYLEMTLAPHDLAIFYPYAPLDPVLVVAATILVAGLTAVAWWLRDRMPAVTVGWAWYVVTLLPVIGLVQAGSQSHADRFTYLPGLGLGLAALWPLDRLVQRTRRPAVWMAGLVLLLAGLGVAGTRRHLGPWENSGTLFRHALAVTTDNYLAHVNLAQFLSETGGDDAEADAHYREALRISPGYVPALVNVGNRLASEGRLVEAEEHYRRAIARDPSVAEAHNGLGWVLDRTERSDAALGEFERALALAPEFVDARLNRAHALRIMQRPKEAIDEYTAVLSAEPGLADAHYGLALARIGFGDERGAAADLDRALRLPSVSPDALEIAAWLRATATSPDVRDPAEAVRLVARAREARGRDTPRALVALATAHLVAGRGGDARDAATRARVLAEGEGDRAASDEAARILRTLDAAASQP